MHKATFEQSYKMLNNKQKEAVDTIDGPVMVVAGPGTGKTEVLALRIANILIKTDIGPHGVLCLTFTNSGVFAMRERLKKYIGEASGEVQVSTFHSFAQKIVEKHYALLDMESMPILIDEQDSVLLFDEILHKNEWEYLRPRNNPSQYFHDLKSLISLLKRESITAESFGKMIDEEIKIIENDPESISSRGESKGQLKKEVEKKIESLLRSKEAVTFYAIYEKTKREQGYMDYDDVLAYALNIINISDDVKSEIQENSQYVLIDEHQDSSGIQNQFLKTIWSEVERPNIFVVGDDRQLIYGFGGASVTFFEEFKSSFGKAHLITLVDNYRSTQDILDTADVLLTSTMAEGKLISNTKESSIVELYTCEYERDEVLLAGQLFKSHIDNGVEPSHCALLVPKNRNVRSAVRILKDMGLPVSVGNNSSFFDMNETYILKNILKAINDPYDSVALGELLFIPNSSIAPLEAHAFLKSTNTRNLSVEDFTKYTKDNSVDLFSDSNPIRALGKSLESFMEINKNGDIYTLLQLIGKEFFIDKTGEHDELVRYAEVIRTYLHLALSHIEKHPHTTLGEFIEYLDRLESYNHHIPLATIGVQSGINVMTLHASKGLEFDVVHIAHMNENSLMNGRRRGFILPESIENIVETKDELTAKRELYVAITRAKRHCTVSYAQTSLSGSTLTVARIIGEIGEKNIKQNKVEDSIKIIGGENPLTYIENNSQKEIVGMKELADIVAKEYMDKNVSVTLLNNFFECPWKWYFNSFLQLPTPKTESLTLGSVVHISIEKILKDKIKVTDKVLGEIVENALDKEIVKDKSLRQRINKNAKKILTNWARNYYPHIHSSYMTERSVSYHDKNFPHLKMYGKIDLTENYDGGITVTDFKTGSSKTKGMIEKRDEEGRLSTLMRQLAMYSYLLTGQNVTQSKLLFLEVDHKDKNAVYSGKVTQEEIDLLVRDISDYDKALSSGGWTTRTCNFKPYGGEQSECEYCKKSEIYKNK